MSQLATMTMSPSLLLEYAHQLAILPRACAEAEKETKPVPEVQW